MPQQQNDQSTNGINSQLNGEGDSRSSLPNNPNNRDVLVETLAHRIFSTKRFKDRSGCLDSNPTCIFSLANGNGKLCSNEEVLHGGMCEVHNKSLYHRGIVCTSRGLKCYAVKNAEYTPTGFIFSLMMPMTVNQVLGYLGTLKACNLSDLKGIAQFISVLSSDCTQPRPENAPSIEMFCLNLAQIYRNILQKLPQELTNATVLLEMSEERKNELERKNLWFHNVGKNYAGNTVSIKLGDFLLIDQIILLGYHIQAKDIPGSLPNVTMSDKHLIHGCGHGIKDSLEVAESPDTNPYCNYSSELRQKLSFVKKQNDLQPLLLSAYSNNAWPPDLLITERSFTVTSLKNDFKVMNY